MIFPQDIKQQDILYLASNWACQKADRAILNGSTIYLVVLNNETEIYYLGGEKKWRKNISYS